MSYSTNRQLVITVLCVAVVTDLALSASSSQPPKKRQASVINGIKPPPQPSKRPNISSTAAAGVKAARNNAEPVLPPTIADQADQWLISVVKATYRTGHQEVIPVNLEDFDKENITDQLMARFIHIISLLQTINEGIFVAGLEDAQKLMANNRATVDRINQNPVIVDFNLNTSKFGRPLQLVYETLCRSLPFRYRQAIYTTNGAPCAQPDELEIDLLDRPPPPKSKTSGPPIDETNSSPVFTDHPDDVHTVIHMANIYMAWRILDYVIGNYGRFFSQVKGVFTDEARILAQPEFEALDRQYRRAKNVFDVVQFYATHVQTPTRPNEYGYYYAQPATFADFDDNYVNVFICVDELNTADDIGKYEPPPPPTPEAPASPPQPTTATLTVEQEDMQNAIAAALNSLNMQSILEGVIKENLHIDLPPQFVPGGMPENLSLLPPLPPSPVIPPADPVQTQPQPQFQSRTDASAPPVAAPHVRLDLIPRPQSLIARILTKLVMFVMEKLGLRRMTQQLLKGLKAAPRVSTTRDNAVGTITSRNPNETDINRILRGFSQS